MHRGRRATFFAAATLSGLFACSTPSVPIPPPELDLSALVFDGGSSGGTFTVVGKADPAHAGAQFFIVDQQSGDGVITKAAGDGSFTSEAFAAANGDTIRIQLENPQGRLSDAYCVTLTVTDTPLSGDTCP